MFDAADMQWRKRLYLPQPYPDNHVPESFLRDLRKNGKAIDNIQLFGNCFSFTVNVKFYSLFDIIRASWIVVQEISLVVIFLEAFYILKFVDRKSVYYCISVLTAILYLSLVLSSSHSKGKISLNFLR